MTNNFLYLRCRLIMSLIELYIHLKSVGIYVASGGGTCTHITSVPPSSIHSYPLVQCFTLVISGIFLNEKYVESIFKTIRLIDQLCAEIRLVDRRIHERWDLSFNRNVSHICAKCIELNPEVRTDGFQIRLHASPCRRLIQALVMFYIDFIFSSSRTIHSMGGHHLTNQSGVSHKNWKF